MNYETVPEEMRMKYSENERGRGGKKAVGPLAGVGENRAGTDRRDYKSRWVIANERMT